MENLLNLPIEPLLSNRFLFKTFGTEIPVNNFRRYKLYNNGEDLILDVDIFETVNFVFDPNEVFNLTDIDIEYVDPAGLPISTMKFEVTGINFEKYGDYAESDLSFVKLIMKVKKRE